MALKFRCPTCQELFSAQRDMQGAEVTCPLCETCFELPREEPPSPEGTTDKTALRADQMRDAVDSQSAKPRHAEPDAAALPITFRRRDGEDYNALDMTPMVDVTFLLLIFFMVTAAFGLQKSYDIPAPDDSRPSEDAVTLEELESDPKYVIVRIDEYDTYHVGVAHWDSEQEAPSKPDLLAKLRLAKTGGPGVATHMVVIASEDATNGRVVTALDSGTATGMEDVKLLTVPSDQ